ncbi:MAG: hypothetical protein VXX15_04870 [Planctomycetota bacterium]|nr:hypothetical protein [Planctomycetota bacterium]
MIGLVVRAGIRSARSILPGRFLGWLRKGARRVLPDSVQQYLLHQERRTFADVQKDDLYFLRDKLIQRQDLMFQKLEQRIERLSQKIDELERDNP